MTAAQLMLAHMGRSPAIQRRIRKLRMAAHTLALDPWIKCGHDNNMRYGAPKRAL